MKLVVSGEYIEAVPESPRETTQLAEFPGFLRNGPRTFAVKKHLVVQNLARRLKAKFGKLSVDKEVYELVNSKLTLRKLPESFTYHTSPKTHQDIALRFLYTLGSAGLLLDPGMGKSKVFLDFIYLMNFRRSLVVCPMALLGTWEDEVERHRPELRIHLVRTTNWVEELPKMKAAQLVVINYDKAVRLYEGLSEEIHFDAINVDEGLIKDPSTQRTKSITSIARGIKHRVINSGTLINNSPLDMFAPVRYLEPSLVGQSYSAFKSVYAIENGGRKKPDGTRGPSFIVGYRNIEEMRDTLESCCIVMTKDEWLTLPNKTFKVLRCITSDEQKRVFSELQSNYVSEFKGRHIEIPTPLVLAAKQCQVANGFIYYSETLDLFDEELFLFEESQVFGGGSRKKAPKGKREILYFEDQPKIEKLRNLLTSELRHRRVMVWYNLQAERILLESLFTELGIEFLTIAGGEKDTSSKVRAFNRDKRFTVLLCQARAVNYGVTVLGHVEDKQVVEGTVFREVDSEVYTQVFYSLNFSLEVFLQQQDRVHRIGQERACEYYILLSDFDVETYVYSVLEEKKSVKESMMVDFVQSRRVAEV